MPNNREVNQIFQYNPKEPGWRVYWGIDGEIWKDVKYIIGCRFQKIGKFAGGENPYWAVVPTKKRNNI